MVFLERAIRRGVSQAVGFDFSRSYGGFDYVAPQPKKQLGLKDLFGL